MSPTSGSNVTLKLHSPRTLRFEPPPVDPLAIQRAVGLQPERVAHQRWLAAVDQQIQATRRLLRPRAVVRIDRVVELTARRLRLDNGAEFHGAVGQFLEHAQYVASFVVTIGSATERLARRWLKGVQLLRGAIVDAIASETVEAVAHRCQEVIGGEAGRAGLAVTPRYSPGYCGMLVTQQRSLFAHLPTHEINVHLNPSCLMLPIKSVSGLVGLAEPAKVGPHVYPCQRCDHPDCMQRRTPFEPKYQVAFDWRDEASAPNLAS